MRWYRFFLALIVVGVFGFSADHLWAQNITYNFVNYPSSQNNDTLSGTITTDGTIGQLADSDILAANFSIVDPTGTYTVPVASVGLTGGTTLMATATELYLPYTVDSQEEFQLIGQPPAGTPKVFLTYFQEPNIGDDLYEGVSTGPDQIFWNTFFFGSPPAASASVPGSTIGNNPMLVATVSVPEPGSLVLLALGMIGLAVARRRVA